MSEDGQRRRRFLRTAVGVSLIGVAGCSSSGSSGSDSGSSTGNGSGASTATEVPGSEVTTEMDQSNVSEVTPVTETQVATATPGRQSSRSGASMWMSQKKLDAWGFNSSGWPRGAANLHAQPGEAPVHNPTTDGMPTDAYIEIFEGLEEGATVSDFTSIGARALTYDDVRGVTTVYGEDISREDIQGENDEVFDEFNDRDFENLEDVPVIPSSDDFNGQVWFADDAVVIYEQDDEAVRDNVEGGYAEMLASHVIRNQTNIDGEYAAGMPVGFFEDINELGANGATIIYNNSSDGEDVIVGLRGENVLSDSKAELYTQGEDGIEVQKVEF